MDRAVPRRQPYSAGAEADRRIRELLQACGSPDADSHLHELVVTAIKLSVEAPQRGELMLLNAAVKELRHAFRVFAPYRERRKVSIFGSARTPRDHPWCGLARDFAAACARAGWMSITGGAAGTLRPAEALAEEHDEPQVAQHPRIVFVARFDRPTALHRLVARLNDAPVA